MKMAKLVQFIKWFKIMFVYYTNKNKNRNKKLWVFGAWGGNKYSDNTKYLYYYTSRNFKNIESFWITKNKDIYLHLKNKNLKTALIGTDECSVILKTAGVAFYTNSLEDFGTNNYLNGATIIALFHGVGFKKELREIKCNLIYKKLKNIIHYIYCPSYFDVCFTSSEFMKVTFEKQQYNTNGKKIFITGQPRNDYFYNALQRQEKVNKNILYMPTFRSDIEQQNKLDKIISSMISSAQLNNLLEKNGYKLLIKTHFLTKVKTIQKENICILNDDDVSDVQELLYKCEVLITDYSSVANDFSLLNRPVVFFPFDLEQNKNLMDDEYNNVLKDTYVKNLDELYILLKKIIEEKVKYSNVNEIINNYFNDKNLKLGTFSKNICNVVFKKIEIEEKEIK